MVDIRLARLETQALSASGHERMVSGRVLVIGEERSDLPETIDRFGDILLCEGGSNPRASGVIRGVEQPHTETVRV